MQTWKEKKLHEIRRINFLFCFFGQICIYFWQVWILQHANLKYLQKGHLHSLYDAKYLSNM